MPSSKTSRASAETATPNLPGLLESKASTKTRASRRARNPASIVVARQRNWPDRPKLLRSLPSLPLAGATSLVPTPPLDGERKLKLASKCQGNPLSFLTWPCLD